MFPDSRRMRVRLIRKTAVIKKYPLCIICGYPVCGPEYQMLGYTDPVHNYHKCQSCNSIQTKRLSCSVCECDLINLPSYCQVHTNKMLNIRCANCQHAMECTKCHKLRTDWHRCFSPCRTNLICKTCAPGQPCGRKALPYVDLSNHILPDLSHLVNEYIVPTCTDPDNPGADYFRELKKEKKKTIIIEINTTDPNLMIQDSKIRENIIKMKNERCKQYDENRKTPKMITVLDDIFPISQADESEQKTHYYFGVDKPSEPSCISM